LAEKKVRKPRAKKEIAQISNIEEREAHLVFDYFTKTVKIYTNNAVVINRIAKKGVEYKDETTVNGKVYGRFYELAFKDMAKVISAGIYR
jgi:hypothetical protein